MSYFHVVAELDGSPEKPEVIFTDLSEAQLRKDFVKPYERGINLLSHNNIYPIQSLRKIQIIETSELSEVELGKLQRSSRRHIDELNQDSSVVFISLDRGYEAADIVEAGNDVTHTLLRSPPGSKSTNRFIPWLNNGWVVGVGGGILVAIITALFKLS